LLHNISGFRFLGSNPTSHNPNICHRKKNSVLCHIFCFAWLAQIQYGKRILEKERFYTKKGEINFYGRHALNNIIFFWKNAPSSINPAFFLLGCLLSNPSGVWIWVQKMKPNFHFRWCNWFMFFFETFSKIFVYKRTRLQTKYWVRCRHKMEFLPVIFWKYCKISQINFKFLVGFKKCFFEIFNFF